MYVKSEPDCEFDLTMEMLTDMDASLLREELFGNHCIASDVSESSSDDDLIHKLSSDLELPLALDDLDPSSSSSSSSWPISEFCTSPTTQNNTQFSSVKFEMNGDMSADELSRALYPNLISGTPTPPPSISEQVKSEPGSPHHHRMTTMPPADVDIWELLYAPDIKPAVKLLDTPPVTPPQSDGSPPHSPQPQSYSPQPQSPVSMLLNSPQYSQTNTMVNTVNSMTNTANTTPNTISNNPNNPTNNITTTTANNKISQPIKVVTITTRNQNGGPTRSGRITKTMKIQPKVLTATNANCISQQPKIVTTSISPQLSPPQLSPSQVPQVPISPQLSPQQVPISTHSPPHLINIINTQAAQATKLTLPKPNPSRIVQVKTGGPTPQTNINPSSIPINTPIACPTPTPTAILSPTPIPSATPTILTTQSLGGLGSTGMVQSTTPLTPLAPALTPGINKGIPDMKAFKRQQRMIKNRESASLSRKKKKEYVTTLEASITELQNHNSQLKEENARLHQRVSNLERECLTLRQSLNPGHSRKTTTALFALIFLFSINLGPLSSVLLSSSESKLSSLKKMVSNPMMSPPAGFPHRSLLWSNPPEVSNNTQDSSGDNSPATAGSSPGGAPLNTSHTCPMYFNETESLRLETELRDWFQHKFGPSKKNQFQDTPQKPPPPAPRKTGRGGVTSRALAGLGGAWNALAPPRDNGGLKAPRLYRYIHKDIQPELLQVEPQSETSIASTLPQITTFLDAIQRRADTYYVISFSPDHLLVPASARNISARPRMSLLLPTPISNESMAYNENNGHNSNDVSLMQIDCEVLNTKLIHVRQDFVPQHLRTAAHSSANATGPSQPAQSSPQSAQHRNVTKNAERRERRKAGMNK